MTNSTKSTQLATVTENTGSTVTFHINVPKDLPKAPAQPSRPQTVSLVHGN